MAKTNQAVVQKLRQAINDELKKISKEAYPNIHTKIKNRAGYEQIEDTIINMIIATKMTPSACIGQLEAEL